MTPKKMWKMCPKCRDALFTAQSGCSLCGTRLVVCPLVKNA